MEKSRLGRDPFNKKRSSPVKSIVQNKVYEQVAREPFVESSHTSRDLLARIQKMEIKMDFGEFIKGILPKKG